MTHDLPDNSSNNCLANASINPLNHNPLIGAAYNKAFIDSNPIPKIDKGLVPWLKRQLEEIREEVGNAPKALIKLQKSMDEVDEALSITSDPENIKKLKGAKETISTLMARNNSIFLEGRIYLLEKMIEISNK